MCVPRLHVLGERALYSNTCNNRKDAVTYVIEENASELPECTALIGCNYCQST